MGKIKIIFTDIDGTLLNSSNGFYFIEPNNIKILKKFQFKETYVVLTTGRNRSETLPIWNKIYLNSFADFIIYEDGKYVENLRKNYVWNVLDFKPFATKGMGARLLMETLNIDNEEAFAIGNNTNDYSLFNEIPNSVAISGSIPSLRKLAKYKTNLSYSKSLETLVK